jgi:hypothetical protein
MESYSALRSKAIRAEEISFRRSGYSFDFLLFTFHNLYFKGDVLTTTLLSFIAGFSGRMIG